MLKAVNHFLHPIMFAMVVLFGRYTTIDLLMVAVCMVACWATTHVALVRAAGRRSPELGALTIGIVLFYWVGFLSKLGLGMLLADQYWVAPQLVHPDALLQQMPVAYALATIGYVALMVAVLTFPIRTGFRFYDFAFRPRLKLLIAVVFIALVLKYFLKTEFDLGIRGVAPVYMGLPFLSGFLTFVIDSGYLFVANMIVFLGLTQGRTRLLIVGFLIATINVLIDLRFGAKDTVIFQFAILLSYLVIAWRGTPDKFSGFRRTFKTAVVALLLIGTSVIAGYKFVNYYRYALLNSDLSTTAAINFALENDSARSQSSFMEIYNRVTGLETFATLLELRRDIAFPTGAVAMVDGSVMRSFTSSILGGRESITAFAVTRFGQFYIAGGLIGLVFGSVFLGLLFCLIQLLVLRLPVHHAMKTAFVPVLWILFANALLGGGDITLWAKEVAVVVGVFYVFSRLAASLGQGWRLGGRRPNRSRPHTLQPD